MSGMHTNPQVDAYIAKSAPFARPVLEHLRALRRLRSTAALGCGAPRLRRW